MAVSKILMYSCLVPIELNVLLDSFNSGQPELYDPDQFLLN